MMLSIHPTEFVILISPETIYVLVMVIQKKVSVCPPTQKLSGCVIGSFSCTCALDLTTVSETFPLVYILHLCFLPIKQNNNRQYRMK